MTENPYAPKAEDAKWTRGAALIDRTSLTGSTADPVWTLEIAGDLPTPCHELRLSIPEKPENHGLLRIEAWSVSDPAKICAQMLQPFSVRVQIRAVGVDTVTVNGKAATRSPI